MAQVIDNSNAPYQSNVGTVLDTLDSWFAELGSRFKYGIIPDVTSIVPSQSSPATVQQATEAGAFTPYDSASIGLATAQAAQMQAIKDAEGVTYFPAGDAYLPNLPSTSTIENWVIIWAIGLGILLLVKK